MASNLMPVYCCNIILGFLVLFARKWNQYIASAMKLIDADDQIAQHAQQQVWSERSEMGKKWKDHLRFEAIASRLEAIGNT